MNIPQLLLLDTYFGEQDSILVLGDFCEENNIYFQGLINANVEESLCSNFHDHNGYGNGYGYGYNYGYGDGNGYGQPINYSDCNDNGDGYSYDISAKEFYL